MGFGAMFSSAHEHQIHIRFGPKVPHLNHPSSEVHMFSNLLLFDEQRHILTISLAASSTNVVSFFIIILVVVVSCSIVALITFICGLAGRVLVVFWMRATRSFIRVVNAFCFCREVSVSQRAAMKLCFDSISWMYMPFLQAHGSYTPRSLCTVPALGSVSPFHDFHGHPLPVIGRVCLPDLRLG